MTFKAKTQDHYSLYVVIKKNIRFNNPWNPPSSVCFFLPIPSKLRRVTRLEKVIISYQRCCWRGFLHRYLSCFFSSKFFFYITFGEDYRSNQQTSIVRCDTIPTPTTAPRRVGGEIVMCAAQKRMIKHIHYIEKIPLKESYSLYLDCFNSMNTLRTYLFPVRMNQRK